MFLVFVAGAQAVHLATIGVTDPGAGSGRVILDGLNGWLERHSRVLLIGLSLVFGTWLIAKALAAFGIL